MPTSSSSNAGFTLIEVVVAMALILISLLGLLQVAGLATAANMKNQLRDEAVLVAEKQMADLMTKPQSAISTTAGFSPFDSFSTASLTRGTGLKFGVTRETSPFSSTSFQYRVTVTWKYKQNGYSHEVEAMRSFATGN
ncbi:prepilin-type N-terminal cleavage/methylation domain-containing protein [Geomesophilobacter sediminis]|uniref:prepilin-type N-terminal cleavage/methylation domain-containing protein n=1 Tax=Geomesophilobacter sediminis TaxID=2798584 RepID=UPI002E29277A|nr:prepilin-type N-terminal cleavage/methylation domain-containing protein [Geomesophilobacter sediminis]